MTTIGTTRCNLFGAPGPDERFAAIADPETTSGQAMIARIVGKIAATRRPLATSAIPAGAVTLAQYVAHDLDHDGRGRLDLGLLYGAGPARAPAGYELPDAPGEPRLLLRLGRTRATAKSPAWGPARDLPRATCPHLDSRPAHALTEVLVPNALVDSNLLLAQTHTLFALLHNAIAAGLKPAHGGAGAFALAQRITRMIYADVVRNDVLGTWLMPAFRARYAGASAHRLSAAVPSETPAEFHSGVGLLAQLAIREVHALNDRRTAVSLRDLTRQTSRGRPHEMPLTQDWLVDFSRFFSIEGSVPQWGRAIGPHVPRLMAAAGRDGTSALQRDMRACCSSTLHSVPSLIARAELVDPTIFEGSFAGDAGRWRAALGDWLIGAGLGRAGADRLAADPPLLLFLMLEAEADCGGRWLGALGSVLMGEALGAALPDAGQDDSAVQSATATIFSGPAPGSMAEIVPFLQRHYQFPEGARLCPAEDPPLVTSRAEYHGGTPMLDAQMPAHPPLPRIDVVDHVEMGRIVTQWASDPASRPADVEQLRQQLDGIAVVPRSLRTLEFAQGTLEHCVIHLPVREIVEESLEEASDPMADTRHPLPQFYADHFRPGFGPVLTRLDTLLARIGDQTIAEGR